MRRLLLALGLVLCGAREIGVLDVADEQLVGSKVPSTVPGGLEKNENDQSKVMEIFASLTDEVSSALNQPPAVLANSVLVDWRKQVVSGTNWFLKVQLPDEGVVFVRLFESLDRKREVAAVEVGHSMDDELDYFK